MNIIKNKKLIVISLAIILVIFFVFSFLTKKEKVVPNNFTKTPQQVAQTADVVNNTEDVKGNFLFAQNSREFYRTHPWYRKLPIETQGYFILWDFSKEQFAIQLKIKADGAPAEISTLTSQAVQEIRNITQNEFDKYEYYILYLK